VIRGERINLRGVEREDAPLLYRWLNDPDTMRFWGAPGSTVSLAEVQRRIEEWLAGEGTEGRPSCLMVETLDGETIGHVVFAEYRPDARSIALSLMIGDAAHRGRGLGKDLLETSLTLCFEEWNLHRVWLRSEASNARAHRLYAGCGFTHEATLRDATFFNGRYEDVFIFAKLRDEAG
jgi:RimJ/RimL family protein N-acetyltransferase